MQIVFPPDLIPGPGLALEVAVPVVGQAAAGFGRPPDVVVGIGLDAAAALLEPVMLVAGVVDHQIHDHLHAPPVGAVQHLPEGLHAAEFRGHIHIIGNIVAAVRPGGGIDGREPDAVHAQRFQIVQLFQNTPQIAHAVSVAVLEAPGPDLIEYAVLVPAGSFHRHHSFCFSIPQKFVDGKKNRG